MGDSVAVEGTSGHDIGIVSLKGELVRLQMRKKKVNIDSEEAKTLYRHASELDLQNGKLPEIEKKVVCIVLAKWLII